TVYHLRNYRWDKEKGKPIKDNVHDHAMDALRYLVVELEMDRAVAPALPMIAGSDVMLIGAR
ncbi:hypothetical protein ACFLQV_01425, partial [Calditrichota bacterium]